MTTDHKSSSSLTSVKLTRALPRLLLVGGGLLVLVAVLGLTIAQSLISSPTTSQDPRTQATNPNGQVIVALTPSTSTVNSGSAMSINGTINTNGVQTDGVQLVFSLNKASVVGVPTVSLRSNSGLQQAFNRVVDLGSSYEIQFLALPQTIGQPFSSTQPIAFIDIALVANQSGNYTLTPDLGRCLSTRYSSDPVVDELRPVSAVSFSIIGGITNPTATPTVTAIPTATPTPTPTTLPAATPTPTPAFTSDQSTLNLSFSLQGLVRDRQQLDGVIYLKQSNSNLDTEEVDQTESTELFRLYDFPAKFISSRGGTVTSVAPIELTNIPISVTGTEYDVLVKTSVSLRKKMGSIVLRPGSNFAPPEWGRTIVKVGDFVQTPQTEWNVLNLRDITQLLAQYTQLQVPVTSANQRYDVNYDNFITIIDIAIVLSNYTQLSLAGE